MKQNTAEKESDFKDQHDTARKSAQDAAIGQREFAKELRALGQAIEKFKFSTFDLQLESGIYVVTGRAVSVENVKICCGAASRL